MNTWSFLEYWRLFGTKEKRVEAHYDLRSAMHSLLGLTEILKDTHLSKNQADLVTGIQLAGRSILEAVDQMNPAAARKSGGSADLLAAAVPVEKDFSLIEMFASLQMIVTAGVYRPDFQLIFEFDPDVETELRGAAGKLVQMLISLIHNHMRVAAPGPIVLSVRSEDQHFGQVLLHFELGPELGGKTAFSFTVTRQGN